MVDLAAERLDVVSTYLTETDGDRIIRDLETVARKQPMVTAAAGLILGLAAARILKAGAAMRDRLKDDPSSATSTSAEIDYGVR